MVDIGDAFCSCNIVLPLNDLAAQKTSAEVIAEGRGAAWWLDVSCDAEARPLTTAQTAPFQAAPLLSAVVVWVVNDGGGVVVGGGGGGDLCVVAVCA